MKRERLRLTLVRLFEIVEVSTARIKACTFQYVDAFDVLGIDIVIEILIGSENKVRNFLRDCKKKLQWLDFQKSGLIYTDYPYLF